EAQRLRAAGELDDRGLLGRREPLDHLDAAGDAVVHLGGHVGPRDEEDLAQVAGVEVGDLGGGGGRLDHHVGDGVVGLEQAHVGAVVDQPGLPVAAVGVGPVGRLEPLRGDEQAGVGGQRVHGHRVGGDLRIVRIAVARAADLVAVAVHLIGVGDARAVVRVVRNRVAVEVGLAAAAAVAAASAAATATTAAAARPRVDAGPASAVVADRRA